MAQRRSARYALWAGLLLAQPGQAGPPADPPAHLTLQLSGVRQAQFAGYYVAAARGIYAAHGLSVTILPGPPNGETGPLRPSPGIDVWSAWMPQALAARQGGADLVNFAQIFFHSGLELTCRKQAGIHAPPDLRHKTAAIWQDGSQLSFLAWMRKLGLAVPADIRMAALAHGAGITPLLDRSADCINTLNYDQYWQLLGSGLTADQLQVFHYGDAGVETLQDGLYATGAAIAAPAQAAILTRFLAASVQGWNYAVTHQDEAVAIVLAGGPFTEADRVRQTRMMSAVARLTPSGLQRMGYLEPAAFDRTTQLLMGSAITIAPSGAWTHAIWKAASR